MCVCVCVCVCVSVCVCVCVCVCKELVIIPLFLCPPALSLSGGNVWVYSETQCVPISELFSLWAAIYTEELQYNAVNGQR